MNLLTLGIAPGDAVVVQLPNVVEFVFVHFALQKIGARPVLALPPHRFREMSYFVETVGAVATITPDAHRDFSFLDMIDRIAAHSPSLRHKIVLGQAKPGFVSLRDLIAEPPVRAKSDLDTIVIDPELPALGAGDRRRGRGSPGVLRRSRSRRVGRVAEPRRGRSSRARCPLGRDTYPAMETWRTSADAQEGPRAFAEKRRPVWLGA